MRIESTPELSDRERRAVVLALARSGVLAGSTSTAGRSSWPVSAVREAVESELPAARYALSPRSTRGATRA